jgi:hypothetical protein
LTSGGSPNRLIIQALNKTTGAFVSNIFDLDSDLNTISLSGAASVAVPAATAATHAVNTLTSTTAALANIGDNINTAGKFIGKQVYNTTTSQPVWATNSGAGAVWKDAQAVTKHTPA